ncbi:hypothetical protein EW145_g14 [Phellinidium pouzarii]|uniref:HIG1 domain-containing protein n=1 Tax=Phellinidium pouzarii TaxID=167371 RepID=A0A4S4LKH5_9AGAM|nr:hypothetical protein EW145_g14 [Phellinidium pouzarii]
MKVCPSEHSARRRRTDDALTQEQEHQVAVVKGGAKGFFGGLAVALPTSFLLQRRSAYYRTLTPALKAFGVVIVSVPAFVICAERAGLAYERTQWRVARSTVLTHLLTSVQG